MTEQKEGGSQSETPTKRKRQKFEVGWVYFSPYRPPGKPPKGYDWIVEERNVEKRYPIRWRLRSTEPEFPTMDDLPPIDEKGRVIKDHQPRLKGFE